MVGDMAVSLPSARPHGRAWPVPGTVEVWRTDLDATPQWLETLLCASEQARAARIVHERTRVRWARSRGLLRLLLARYLDADPRELRFALGAHGKPALAGGPVRGLDLRFNLSHSEELLLVAVAVGMEVGADIECADVRHTSESLRAWTLHEATVKCLGRGLTSMPLEEGAPSGRLWVTELDVGPDATAALAVELTPRRASARRWPRASRAGCPPASV
jgi:phosphopantetheinyl transferase